MKKLSALLLAVLTALLFSGCGAAKPEKSDKLNVVCTIFPIYDWTREIAGDSADVTLLLKNSTDMHSYQPTADDFIKIASADVLIYVGGESDKWVKEACERSPSKSRTQINLIDLLGTKAITEEHEEEHHGEHTEEYDEHIWLSLENAAELTMNISKELGKMDYKNRNIYKENADLYIENLNKLDKEYKNAAETAKIKTLIFADRFPFAYLLRDYGISYTAAFPGCSAETEASFEIVTSLAKTADETGARYIFTTESPQPLVAKTVINNTENKNQKILMLDSMQSVTEKRIEGGETYISIAENNLKQLKKGLDNDGNAS